MKSETKDEKISRIFGELVELLENHFPEIKDRLFVERLENKVISVIFLEPTVVKYGPNQGRTIIRKTSICYTMHYPAQGGFIFKINDKRYDGDFIDFGEEIFEILLAFELKDRPRWLRELLSDPFSILTSVWESTEGEKS